MRQPCVMLYYINYLHHNIPTATTALDHWVFDDYNIWLEGSGTSAGHKGRIQRHSPLPFGVHRGKAPVSLLLLCETTYYETSVCECSSRKWLVELIPAG